MTYQNKEIWEYVAAHPPETWGHRRMEEIFTFSVRVAKSHGAGHGAPDIALDAIWKVIQTGWRANTGLGFRSYLGKVVKSRTEDDRKYRRRAIRRPIEFASSLDPFIDTRNDDDAATLRRQEPVDRDPEVNPVEAAIRKCDDDVARIRQRVNPMLLRFQKTLSTTERLTLEFLIEYTLPFGSFADCDVDSLSRFFGLLSKAEKPRNFIEAYANATDGLNEDSAKKRLHALRRKYEPFKDDWLDIRDEYTR